MAVYGKLSRYPTLLAEAHELTSELESLGDPESPRSENTAMTSNIG